HTRSLRTPSDGSQRRSSARTVFPEASDNSAASCRGSSAVGALSTHAAPSPAMTQMPIDARRFRSAAAQRGTSVGIEIEKKLGAEVVTRGYGWCRAYRMRSRNGEGGAQWKSPTPKGVPRASRKVKKSQGWA